MLWFFFFFEKVMHHNDDDDIATYHIIILTKNFRLVLYTLRLEKCIIQKSHVMVTK